jgi:hypothetical protein
MKKTFLFMLMAAPAFFAAFVSCGGDEGGKGRDKPLVALTWANVKDGVSLIVRDIAYGVDKFVAVGDSNSYGRMMYSPDGVTWIEITNSTFSNPIRGVAYGGGKFVAVGARGRMAYSSDGIAWLAVADSTFDSESTIRGVAYGNGKFVAVGARGRMAYSPDGIAWTAVADSPSGSFYDIVYGEDKFVAVGANAFSGKIVYSLDGIAWTTVADSKFAASSSIEGVAYGGGRFVAVGADGSFDKNSTNYTGKIAYSTNGVTWRTAVMNNTFGGAPSAVYSVTYGRDKFVAGGFDGKMAYSANGVAWTAITPRPLEDIDDVAYGGGKFVVSGGFGIAYSNNQE